MRLFEFFRGDAAGGPRNAVEVGTRVVFELLKQSSLCRGFEVEITY